MFKRIHKNKYVYQKLSFLRSDFPILVGGFPGSMLVIRFYLQECVTEMYCTERKQNCMHVELLHFKYFSDMEIRYLGD